jgi:hypothetical protein
MFFVNFLLFTVLSSRERSAQVMLYDVSGDTLCVFACAYHNFVSEIFFKMYTFWWCRSTFSSFHDNRNDATNLTARWSRQHLKRHR